MPLAEIVAPGSQTSLLKSLREEAGLTQSQVARAIGVESVTVSRWERGAVGSIKTENLMALAKLFHVPVDDLARRLGIGQGDASPSAALPRQLRKMADDFLAAAAREGADEPFLRYARNSLADPDFVALFAGGPDETPMTAEEAIDDMKAHIAELRAILKTRLKRARERSGKLAPRELDE